MIRLDFDNIEELKTIHYNAVLSNVMNTMSEENRDALYNDIRKLITDLPEKRDQNDYDWLKRFILADVNTLENWVVKSPNLLKFTTFLEIYSSEFATTDKFVDLECTYNAYKLLERMDLHVCPYCEDEYFDIVENKKGPRRTNDYDHFYPKGKKKDYPALAMCFFNLIPSGKVCNYLMNNIPVAANPYHPDIESWSYFQSNIPIGSEYEALTLNDFTVTLVCKHHMVANEDVLSIQSRYNNRHQEIRDILIDARDFSKERLDELERILGDTDWIKSQRKRTSDKGYPKGRGQVLHTKLRHDLTGL